jgi:hypothetical protein
MFRFENLLQEEQCEARRERGGLQRGRIVI